MDATYTNIQPELRRLCDCFANICDIHYIVSHFSAKIIKRDLSETSMKTRWRTQCIKIKKRCINIFELNVEGRCLGLSGCGVSR